MAYCRLYRPSDASNVRICRKCNKCVILDEPSDDESKKTNQERSCRREPNAYVSDARICVKNKMCMVTEDSKTFLATNKSTNASTNAGSPCHCPSCPNSTYQQARDEQAQVCKKCKKCKISEESQTDLDSPEETQTIVIEIAKHKNAKTKIIDKQMAEQGSRTTSTQNDARQKCIAQEPSDEKLVRVDTSTSYTVLSAEKKTSEAKPTQEPVSEPPVTPPVKKKKSSFFAQRSRKSSKKADEEKSSKKANKEKAQKESDKEKAQKASDMRSQKSFASGDASSARSPPEPIKTVNDAQLLEEIARIRKLLEKSTESAIAPNTNTIILPTGSKIGEQSEELKRLQAAFRDGAQNSKKDLQDVLNEVQNQKQEIAALKQLLSAFLDSYDRGNKPDKYEASKQGSIREPDGKSIGSSKKEPDGKSTRSSKKNSEPNKDKSAEKRTLNSEKRKARGDGDSESVSSSSGAEGDSDPPQKIDYKKPAGFSDEKKKKKGVFSCCRGRKSKGAKNFEERHDPRRQTDVSTT